jgi:Ca2+-binding RTX toxin-like protein
MFGRNSNDFLAGDRGNDRLDGGAGVDSGTGGYQDRRIDWISSLERFGDCESP